MRKVSRLTVFTDRNLQAAFREISRLKLPFPLVFRIENGKRRSSGKVATRSGKLAKDFRQFCGVQEFSAKRGTAIMPKWMMRNLKIRDGGRAFFTSIRGVRKLARAFFAIVSSLPLYRCQKASS